MIYIITGNICSGKTNYTHKLGEKSGGIIFSIGDWINTLFAVDKSDDIAIEWEFDRATRIEKIIWNLCVQLDMQSQDVILDLGFETYLQREKFRQLAVTHELDYKLVYLDFPRETRWQRFLKRNEDLKEDPKSVFDEKSFEIIDSKFESDKSIEMMDEF